MKLPNIKHRRTQTASEPDRTQAAYDAYWDRQKQTIISAYVNSLLIACCLITGVLEIFGGDAFTGRFALDSGLVAAGRERYRLLTAVFLHASPTHLFSNMSVLFFMGAGVEKALGHIKYLVLFLAGGVFGNIVTVLWDVHRGQPTWSIGASGAVFAVMGAVAVIYISGKLVDMAGNRHRSTGMGVRLILMILYSLYSGFVQPNVNNAAHVGGLVMGVIITTLFVVLGRQIVRWDEL